MNKKDEILKAAYIHFAKRGYNVSMSDIAKEVGMKTPSLYSHFSGKDEIVFLTIEKEITRYYEFLDEIYEVCSEPLTKDNLRTTFYAILDCFKKNDKLRFWRNILLIDQDELRKKCSDFIFKLEVYHQKKLEHVFEQGIVSNKLSNKEIEGHALHFLAILQGALEIELLFYESENTADEYIAKLWETYSTNVFRD